MTPPMLTMTLRAPTPYLSMNDRSHWRTRARQVKAWRTLAAASFARAEVPCPGDVFVQLDVTDRRRRDPHNYYPTIKALIDGMTDAGAWPDDTPEYVHTNEPTFRVVPRGTPLCVTVTIRHKEQT